MPARPADLWMHWPRKAPTSAKACCSPARAMSTLAASCSFKPRHWTPTCRPACHKARRTTRYWGSCRPWVKNMHHVRWCWSPKTSICVSKRGPWAWLQKTIKMTRCWRTATCCTPASCRCRPISGHATAKRSKAGSKVATRFTESVGQWCPVCSSINSFILKRQVNPACMPG